jgi:hypothetical protein
MDLLVAAQAMDHRVVALLVAAQAMDHRVVAHQVVASVAHHRVVDLSHLVDPTSISKSEVLLAWEDLAWEDLAWGHLEEAQAMVEDHRAEALEVPQVGAALDMVAHPVVVALAMEAHKAEAHQAMEVLQVAARATAMRHGVEEEWSRPWTSSWKPHLRSSRTSRGAKMVPSRCMCLVYE